MKLKKIEFESEQGPIKLSVEDARKLYHELDELFGSKPIMTLPYIAPLMPADTHPYPTWRTDPIYCTNPANGRADTWGSGDTRHEKGIDEYGFNLEKVEGLGSSVIFRDPSQDHFVDMGDGPINMNPTLTKIAFS